MMEDNSEMSAWRGVCARRRGYRKWMVVIGVLAALLFLVYDLMLSDQITAINIERKSYISGLSTMRKLAAANCSPSSADEFPDDLFTLEQRRGGAVILHLLVAIYMFAALGIVCDDYFVSSLEHLSAALHMKPDVAGATFMAAGSSAPELFTSMIGVFITRSDVGVGTIVGSAVFNILCIVAICGIFAGMVIQLTWWPITRDTVYYMFSVLALILVMYDDVIHWYEALLFVVMYLIYIGIMYFNERLEAYFQSFTCGGGYQPMDAPETTPLASNKKNYSHSSFENSYVPEKEGRLELASSDGEAGNKETGFGSREASLPTFSRTGSIRNLAEVEVEEYESPLTMPESLGSRCYWFLMLPLHLCLIVTVPDCRRPGVWRRLYVLTFIMSIVWIAALSYVMVWMVVVFGQTMGIPDTVMGLTLLAAGTSVPDAMAGLFVARDGFGDMAVCNAVGSNVFDILICLGLPWLLSTTLIGGAITISSSGLLYSSITLLSTVFLLLIFLRLCKWKLSIKSGLVFLTLYIIVITFACLYELNIFGELNPPPCE